MSKLNKPTNHGDGYGLGSGYDGYDVVAVDACKELIELATDDDDVDYKVSTLEDFLESNTTKFDGIWCCASLLHVE